MDARANPNGLPSDDFAIVSALLDAALAKGYSVSVHDGETWPVKRSTDRAALMDAIGTTDMDTLRIRKPCGAVHDGPGHRCRRPVAPERMAHWPVAWLC